MIFGSQIMAFESVGLATFFPTWKCPQGPAKPYCCQSQEELLSLS